MQKTKAFKIVLIGLMIVLASLAGVMYALAYTEKREVPTIQLLYKWLKS